METFLILWLGLNVLVGTLRVCVWLREMARVKTNPRR